jgi:metal-sulfur cluster biosynthetic enzyme
MTTLENPNPEIDLSAEKSSFLSHLTVADISSISDPIFEPVSVDEIYELLKDIRDPEHPDLTLAQLRVVKRDQIFVQGNQVLVFYTPTIPTCSVAVLIGLTLLRKLQLCVPSMYKVRVKIAKDKHVHELQVNKQLADKERIAASMENPNLGKMVRDGLYKTDVLPEQLVLW